jgi:hypothetical protein
VSDSSIRESFIGRDSVSDSKKPRNPKKRSVTTNPTRDSTRIFSAGALKRVVKMKIAVSSRVPNPANVIGMNPAVFAIGNSNRNARYGMSNPSARRIIYSWENTITQVKIPRINGRIIA